MYEDIFKNQVLKEDMLFHYTSWATAYNYILKNMNLRYSSFEKVNDPKESKPRNIIASLNICDLEKRFSSYWKICNEVENILLRNSKVLCFSENDVNIINRIIEEKRDKGLLYKTGFFKPRMWDQYGDSFRGVCLCFDKEKLLEEFQNNSKRNFFYSKVNYTDSTLGYDEASTVCLDLSKDDENITELIIEEYVKKNKENLYFTKTLDWENENEFRLTYISEEMNKDEFISIQNSLISIVLGIDFPEKEKMKLRKVLLGTNIKVYRIGLYNAQPTIEKIIL